MVWPRFLAFSIAIVSSMLVLLMKNMLYICVISLVLFQHFRTIQSFNDFRLNIQI